MVNRKNKFDFSLLALIVTTFSAVFVLGSYSASTGLDPIKFIKKGFSDSKALVDEQTRTYPILLQAKFYSHTGVGIHDESKTYTGLTMMQGWFSDGLQLRLLDMDGNILNQWAVDFKKIWPNPDHISPQKNIPKTRFNYHSQGMHVFPDGSVMVNIGNAGTFKMSKCGNILWTLDRMTHHSITQFTNGSFWIPANRNFLEIEDELLFGRVTKAKLSSLSGRYENLLLNIDENGKVVKEFSVLQAIVDAGMEYQLFNSISIRSGDPTHINDITEVTQALADKIEGVFPGDLLVSIRQFHMLAIFDAKTGKIKWQQTGPWVAQHDPDITPEGNITVFNNRKKRFFVRGGAGSNILEFDPVKGQSKVRYPSPESKHKKSSHRDFYTDIMGTHQVLPNGNILITESTRGRVFEVTSEGETVWEYISAYDKRHASLIEEAQRFNTEYFKVEDWSCN